MPLIWTLVVGASVVCSAWSQGVDSSLPRVESDSANWKIRRFDTRHGLPQSRIQTLTRDSDGWVWCGTLRGLARFEGQRFEKVPAPLPEISPEWTVTFAAAGPDQELWLAYDYDHFYARHEGRWQPLDATEALNQFGRPRFGAFLAPGIAVLEDMAALRHCVVQLEPIPGGNLGLESKARFRLKVLRIDLWPNLGPIQLVDHGNGLVHARDREGTWWKIGTEGRQGVPSAESSGLEARWNEVERNRPFGFRYSFVDSGIDGIWVGSDQSGLLHIAPPGVVLYSHTGQPAEDNVNCISAAGDGSVIQSGRTLVPKSRNYVRLHRKGGTLGDWATEGETEPVLALAGGTNWWAKRGNIYEVTPLGAVSLRQRDEDNTSGTTALSSGTSGQIWWSRPTEVKETRDRSRWTRLPLPKVSMQRTVSRWLSVLEGADGSLWVGSIDYGACHLLSDRCERHTTTNGAPCDILNPMLADPDGTVWFASTVGLLRWRNGGWFVFDTRHGLGETMVLNVLGDLHGRLWVQGYQGIAGISRAELESVARGESARVRLFRPPDSLAWSIEGNGGTAPSASQDGRGNLWFATISGALCVPVEQLQPREIPPPILRSISGVSGVFWDDLKNPRTNEVRLDASAQVELALRVINPARAHADLAPMEHRLDPLDSDWQKTPDDGRALYRRLGPGTYHFRVRSAEALGPAETCVQLEIPAAWHQTVTARGIACSGLLLGIYAGTTHYRRRKREQEEARFHARDEARRWQITRDLHDGIGAGLARISMLANDSAPHLAESAQNLIRNLDELIWVTDPRRDHLEGTIQYLMGVAQSQLSGLSIDLRFDMPDEFPSQPVAGPVRHQLVQWFRGALSNVIKHSGSNRVIIRAQILAGKLVLEVVDNGRGFRVSQPRPDRTGLKILRERIEALGGEFQCDSIPGAGTQLACRIPLARLNHEPSSSHDG